MPDSTGQPAAAAPEQTPTASATPPAAPSPEKSKPTTVLADPGDGRDTAPADWPDDWRAKLAGDDKKILKRLERFQSPADVWKSYASLEQKFKKGEPADAFPAEGSDEDKATWREAHGVPKSPQDYDLTLPDGLVIGENDKPLIEKFLTEMHGTNASPETVKGALTAYYRIQDQVANERAAQDDTDKTAARDTLRDEFGADFQRNLSAAFGLFEDAPDDVRDQIMGARLADGTALGNHAPTLRWLTKLAMEINPLATVAPGARGASAASAAKRKSEIQGLMADHGSAYWSGPQASALQQEYREILEAEERMAARGRA